MDLITEKDCYVIMEKLLERKGFDVEKFAFEELTEIKGFHGSYGYLKITATVDGDEKDYSFFLKIATKSKIIFEEYIGPSRLYFKEHGLITKIIPELQTQINKKLTAKCYHWKLNKFLVLENLNEAGYVSKIGAMDLNHAKIAVETLADFHACSLLTEEKGVNIGEKYSEYLFEMIYSNYPRKNFFNSFQIAIREVAKKLSNLPVDIQKERFDIAEKRMIELLKPSKKYRNVWCQGDPLGNNMMFRYEGKLPKDCVLLDFQGSRFVPPAVELLQFLYITTESSFRKEHGDAIKEVYYTRLAQTLSSHGCDPNKCLSRKEFEESCDYYKEVGINVQLIYTYCVKIPLQYLAKLMKDERMFLNHLTDGDYSIPLEAMMQDDGYRRLVADAIDEVLQFYAPTARK